MLDLQKYLRRAKADPGFRARLLKNANQAIKDEFGEELPYKLKCKEKLSFEIEVTDEMSDADAKSVAGGGGPGLTDKIKNVKEWMKQFKSNPQYTYPQPGPSNPSPNPSPNPVTNPSSKPRDPARTVYGANPSARYW